MKELEKTKRISISAVLFLLVFVIGLLTFEKPKYVFDKGSKTTLKQLVDRNYIMTLKEFKALSPSKYQLVDIRSSFEYNKGSLKNALNIPMHQILEGDSFKFLENLKNTNKQIIAYGKTPEEANSTWMLLYQLGYDNVKILCVETEYNNNKFQVKEYALEKPSVRYAEVYKKAIATKSKSTVKITPKKPKKRVISLKKKKKRKPEGGC